MVSVSSSDWTSGDATREAQGASALLGILRRRAALVVLVALVAAAVAAVVSRAQEPRYEATALLLFRPLGPEFQILGLPVASGPDQEAQASADLIFVSARDVAERAARASAAERSAKEIERRISVSPQGSSRAIRVTAFADDPAVAAVLANDYARAARDLRLAAEARRARAARRVLGGQWEALSPAQRRTAQGADLRGQLRDLAALERLGTGSPELVERAVPPAEPVAPRVRRNILLGGLFGLLLGGAVAAVREQGDRRLRDRRGLEAAFRMPVLAQVPRARALARRRRRRFSELPPTVAEAFRLLQANLRYGHDDTTRRLILTSAVPAEGKSTIAWNLAAAAASAGLDVLLVEGDLRRPDFARRGDLARGPGLGDVLDGEADLTEVIQSVPIDQRANGQRSQAHMDVVVAGQGPSGAVDLLQSPRLQYALEQAGKHRDLVVVDAPPLPVVADAVPLVRQADGVVVVARLGRTTADQAAALRHQLAALDATVLGVVANGVAQGQTSTSYARRPVTA